jgi:hypothetical protein
MPDFSPSGRKSQTTETKNFNRCDAFCGGFFMLTPVSQYAFTPKLCSFIGPVQTTRADRPLVLSKITTGKSGLPPI